MYNTVKKRSIRGLSRVRLVCLMTFGLCSVAVCVCEREGNRLQLYSQGFSPRNYNTVTVASVCMVTNGYNHMHTTTLPEHTCGKGYCMWSQFCVPLHKAGAQ